MNIVWFSGNTGAGKTTEAKKYIKQLHNRNCFNAILLDGDEVRYAMPGLGFSRADRFEQSLRIANLALLLQKQGFIVVVANICPYNELQEIVREKTKCLFVYVTGGQFSSKECPYETPIKASIIIKGNE